MRGYQGVGDSAFLPDLSPVPIQVASIPGCLDLCSEIGGADTSRPIGTAAALPGVRRKVSSFPTVVQQQPQSCTKQH